MREFNLDQVAVAGGKWVRETRGDHTGINPAVWPAPVQKLCWLEFAANLDCWFAEISASEINWNFLTPVNWDPPHDLERLSAKNLLLDPSVAYLYHVDDGEYSSTKNLKKEC